MNNKIKNLMLDKEFIKLPVNYCYFCEKEIKSFADSIKFNSESLQEERQLKLKDATQIKEVACCNKCLEKYLLLIKYEGFEIIKQRLEDLKVSCWECRLKLEKENTKVLFLNYYCERCYNEAVAKFEKEAGIYDRKMETLNS